ncbi:MAG TPA: hypothetical protein VG818_13010 [Gemmatimonadaceae bacterium]|jgi:hypothetical protein|nr:hypothetical protein [Gemmatimonadaceae bacterium]
MKAIRALTVAAAALSLLPAVAAAQSGRPFNDAWFWGIKGGSTFMSAPSKPNLTSPMAGLDWMITRTHGGLYVSFDQSFFNAQGAINDSIAPTDSGRHVVNLKDVRRLTIALMGFPGDNPTWHPYAGLGITYNQVASVKPATPYNSSDQASLGQAIIAQAKAVFAPVLMLGVQARARQASVFLQGMAWPSNSNFFLYNTHGFNGSLEAGVRINVGSAIADDR